MSNEKIDFERSDRSINYTADCELDEWRYKRWIIVAWHKDGGLPVVRASEDTQESAGLALGDVGAVLCEQEK